MPESFSVPKALKNKKDLKLRRRTIARAGAVQALFQYEQSGESIDQILIQFHQYRGGAQLEQFEEGKVPEADMPLLSHIVRKTASDLKEIDTQLSGLLPKEWPLKQIDSVLRAILRAGLAELKEGLDPGIVINEYMDVTHCFLDVQAARLANGVLEAASKQKR